MEWERDHKDVPKKVQDAYTLRCIPQVHGVVHDTLNFVRGILKVEMNSATDNPVNILLKNMTSTWKLYIFHSIKGGAYSSRQNHVWWKLSWGIPRKGIAK